MTGKARARDTHPWQLSLDLGWNAQRLFPFQATNLRNPELKKRMRLPLHKAQSAVPGLAGAKIGQQGHRHLNNRHDHREHAVTYNDFMYVYIYIYI